MTKWLLLAALGLTLTACGSDLAPSLVPDGALTATLTGDLSRDYTGDGTFYVGVFEDGSPQFSVYSQSRVSSGRETIVFSGVFAGVPQPGTYPFVAHDREFPPERPVGGFNGTYSWLDYTGATAGDLIGERYEARDGHVEILTSSADRIEGRFNMLAPAVCRTTQLHEGHDSNCDAWSDPGAASRLVTVTGTFVLVPYESEDSTAPLPDPSPGD